MTIQHGLRAVIDHHIDMACLLTWGNAGFHRHDKVKEHAEFIIDETFGVPGVGTVIAGTVKRGVITTNANLMLGPDVGDGTFKPTAIKSIQYKRLPVTRVQHSLSRSLVSHRHL